MNFFEQTFTWTYVAVMLISAACSVGMPAPERGTGPQIRNPHLHRALVRPCSFGAGNGPGLRRAERAKTGVRPVSRLAGNPAAAAAFAELDGKILSPGEGLVDGHFARNPGNRSACVAGGRPVSRRRKKVLLVRGGVPAGECGPVDAARADP